MTGHDTAPALKGLVLGLLAIGLIVVTIVYLTNKKFEGHEPSAAAATH